MYAEAARQNNDWLFIMDPWLERQPRTSMLSAARTPVSVEAWPNSKPQAAIWQNTRLVQPGEITSPVLPGQHGPNSRESEIGELVTYLPN